MDIRKRKGFTLIEVMMAVGISSFLLLIVQQLMTKTFRTSRSAEQKSQIREIAVSSMLMLEKIESCNETLVGLDVSGSDVPGIKNSRGGVMYAVAPNGIIGTGASRIEIESIRIDGYENIAAPYFNGEDQATVTMTFKRGSAIGVDLSTLTQEELGKLRTRESGGRLVEVHRFSVNVSTIPSSTIIDSCKYSLFESSGNELSSACTMIGGSEVSGRCRDIQVESIDATARNGAANIGAALYVDGDVTAITSGNISTGATDYRTDLVADNYVRTDQLVTRPTVSPGTTSGYSVVLDSIMTTSLGGGSKTYPSSGILDTSGTLLVGTSSSDYIPTGLGGIAVANDLILPSGSRLYVNALSDSYATTSENDRIVITADWAANKIADAMTDGSGSHPSITSIKDSILAGGANVAREALLSYMCENLRVESMDFSGGFGAASTDTNYVQGSWNYASNVCNLNVVYKRNCSVTGSCLTIDTQRLCLTGDRCMTRWPYGTKKAGTCSWKATCAADERQFGYSNNHYSSWRRMCCEIRMDDVATP